MPKPTLRDAERDWDHYCQPEEDDRFDYDYEHEMALLYLSGYNVESAKEPVPWTIGELIERGRKQL